MSETIQQIQLNNEIYDIEDITARTSISELQEQLGGNDTNSVVIGTGSAIGENSTAIGSGSAEGTNSVVIGSGTAYSENSIAIGANTKAGCKGFYFSHIICDDDNNNYYFRLSTSQTEMLWSEEADELLGKWQEGDQISYTNGTRYVLKSTIVNIEVSGDSFPSAYVYVDTFPSKDFTKYEPGEGETLTYEQYSIVNPYRPEAGIIPFAAGSFSVGENNSTTGSNSVALGKGNMAAAEYSYAEGWNTIAKGTASHAEGYGTIAGNGYSHAEGFQTTTNGSYSHAEGCDTLADKMYSHAEGVSTIAKAYAAHAEGANNVTISNVLYNNPNAGAKGYASHIEGIATETSGQAAHAEGQYTLASGKYAHAEGLETQALDTSAHAEGSYSIAQKTQSHAEGYGTIASGKGAHAEGGEQLTKIQISGDANTLSYTLYTNAISIKVGQMIKYNDTYATILNYPRSSNSPTTQITVDKTLSNNKIEYSTENTVTILRPTASGTYSHAEGYCTVASGNYSHVEGMQSRAVGDQSHAEGVNTIANAKNSHVEGHDSQTNGEASHAQNKGTVANGYATTAIGQYNKDNSTSSSSYTVTNNAFIIGNGSANSTSSRANAFRVTFDGKTYGLSAFQSTGADYAEYFEWADQNPNAEDRIGRFVTLVDGNQIRLANIGDEILGVISGHAAILGDAYEDSWTGMYDRDIYGRLQYEEVEVEYEEEDEEGNPITRIALETHIKLNPNYDPTQTYVPRSERPEWAPVGLLGKLVVIDDGTCIPGGKCTCSVNGVAMASDTGYHVLKRLDDTHIQILLK